jgi:hypothetical protein
MEKLFKKWKEYFRSRLGSLLLLTLIPTCLLIASLLTYLDIVSLVDMNEQNKLLVLVFSCVFEAASIAAVVAVTVVFYMDYRLIRTESFRVIDGVISRFEFGEEGTEPPISYRVPIVKDLKSGESLALTLDREVNTGERYLIYYLPRTKIAVIFKSEGVFLPDP